jgi:hypothetical protein
MIIFDYPAILADAQSNFEMDYAAHHRWLITSRLGFKISTFHFPDFVSPRSQSGQRLRCYRVEIDDPVQAALFALFSNLPPTMH